MTAADVVERWRSVLGSHGSRLDVELPPARPVLCLAATADAVLCGTADGEVMALSLADGSTLPAPVRRPAPVRAVAVNWDGRLAASAAGGSLSVFEVATGRAVWERTSHDGGVTQLRFSPDGTTLYSGGADRIIRGWAVADGTETLRLEGHTGTVTALAVGADGGILVSGGRDRTVRLWDTRSRTPLQVLAGHKRDVDAVDLAPDGRSVLSGGKSGAVLVWDLPAGTPRPVRPGHSSHVTGVAFTQGGRAVSAGYDGSVRFWYAGLPHVLGGMLADHGTQVTGLALLPDGVSMVTCDMDGGILLSDAATGRPVRVVRMAPRLPSALMHSMLNAHRDRPTPTLRALSALAGRATAAGLPVRLFRGIGDGMRAAGERLTDILGRPAFDRLWIPSPVRLTAGWRRLAARDPVRARQIALRVLGSDPERHDATMLLAYACRALDDHAAADALHGSALIVAGERHRNLLVARAQHIAHVARGHQPLYRTALRHAMGARALQRRNMAVLNDLVAVQLALGDDEAARGLLDSDEYREAELAYNGILSFGPLVDWMLRAKRMPLAGLAPRASSDRPRYLATIVVWGDAFIDSLASFTLPSLLAAGNIPHLAAQGDVRLVFFTAAASADRLAHLPAIDAIRRHAIVDIVSFPDAITGFPEKYKIMSAMHVVALTMAKAEDAHFIFLAPDIIVSDNYLKALDARRAAGKGIIMVAGLMLDHDSFRAELGWTPQSPDDPLSVGPEALLGLAVRHLHQASIHNIHAPVSERSSVSVVLWPLRNGGYLAHGFHHTPYLVSNTVLRRYDGSMFLTIDSDFLTRIVRTPADLDDCDLILDAREANYFELSRPSRNDYRETYTHERMVRWGAIQGVTAHWLFAQKVLFDPGGSDPDDPAFARSDAVVADILRRLAATAPPTPRQSASPP